MQLFLVQPDETSNIKVIVWALDREDAKRKAENAWLRGYGRGPDRYIVTPLTNPGDRIHIALNLNV